MADGMDVATLKLAIDASDIVPAETALMSLAATSTRTADTIQRSSARTMDQQLKEVDRQIKTADAASRAREQAAREWDRDERANTARLERSERAIERYNAVVLSVAAQAEASERRMTLAHMEALTMNERVEEGVQRHASGLGRLALMYGGVFSHATGANHAIVRTGEVIATAFTGHIEIVIFMAALAALAILWEKLGETAREAAKEQEEAVKRVQAAIKEERLGKQANLIEDEHALIGRLLVLRKEIRDLESVIAVERPGGGRFATDAAAEQARVKADLDAKKVALRDINELLAVQRARIKEATDADEERARNQATRAAEQRERERDRTFDLRNRNLSEDFAQQQTRRYGGLAETVGGGLASAATAQAWATAQQERLAHLFDGPLEDAKALNKALTEDITTSIGEGIAPLVAMAEAARKHAKDTADSIKTMWRDIQRDLGQSISGGLGGGLLGKVGGDVFGAGAAQVLRDALVPAFDAIFKPIKDVLASIEKSIVRGLGGKVGDSLGDALGDWAKTNPWTALGIGAAAVGLVALATSLGMFVDSADEARRAAVELARATNTYAVVAQAFTRSAAGGGSTYKDDEKRLRDEFYKALAASVAMGQGAGSREERRLLAEYATAVERLREDYRTSLQARLKTASGDATGGDMMTLAMTQQREARELAASGADEVTMALLRQAQAAERAAFVTARFGQVLESLTTFASSLKLSALTTLTPGQQVAEARTQYEATLAKARMGDQAAAMRLPDLAQQYLTASRSYNASGNAYASDFARVQSDTAAVLALFEAQKTQAQQALDEAVTSNTLLSAGFSGVVEGITGLRGDVARLAAAVEKQGEANGLARATTV